MILFFLSFILFLIPGLGELAVAFDLTRLGRIIKLVGEVAEGAARVYDVVSTPENASGVVFGALLSGFIMTSAPKYSGKAAGARRTMSAAHVS